MRKRSFWIISFFIIIFAFGSCKNDSGKYQGLPQELVELSRQIDRNPKNDRLYYDRASYYYKRSKIEEAMADILTAIKLDPEKSIYYILLSDIYFAQRETDLTEETLQKVIAMDPDNNEARLKLGELYFHLKMKDESMQVLDEAVQRQPHNPKAHLMRAFLMKELQDTTGYLRMLQLTIDQDPKEVKAFLELGYFYQQTLNPLAIQYYSNALQADPNNVEINYNLGKLFQDLGDIERATEQYQILLQISPRNKLALNNLGYIKLVHEDQYNEAVQYFNQAIDEDPVFINAIANRGIAYTYLGEYELAQQDFQHALSIDPNFEPAISGLNHLDKMR